MSLQDHWITLSFEYNEDTLKYIYAKLEEKLKNCFLKKTENVLVLGHRRP